MGYAMATKYFGKELPEAPVYVNGTPLKFEVLETQDPVLISELTKCIARGKGGVSEITKEQFDEAIKKKLHETKFESGYRQNRRRQELSPQLQNRLLAAGGDGSMPNFAGPQFGRESKPNNFFGLPTGATGPSGGRPMPDPIEIPTVDDLKPPTAKLSEIVAAMK